MNTRIHRFPKRIWIARVVTVAADIVHVAFLPASVGGASVLPIPPAVEHELDPKTDELSPANRHLPLHFMKLIPIR
jgi:hypothetical protein